jgi:hypothetical protein
MVRHPNPPGLDPGTERPMSDNIFREVDEELRNERLRALWNRYGIFIIAGAVAIVLVVAGNEAYKWWQGSTAARSSDLFQTALDDIAAGDLAAGQEALDTTIAEASGRYPMLARFRAASLMAEQGRTADAIAAYDELAGTVDNPRVRELALLYASYLLVDDGDVAGVTSRVGGMLFPDHPMRNIAREVLGLANYRAGDLDAAMGLFRSILDDPQTSQQLGTRAAIYLAQLAAEGHTLPEPAADNATPAAGADQGDTQPAGQSGQ